MPLITFEGCGKTTQANLLAARQCLVLLDGRMSFNEIEDDIWRTISMRFPELPASPQSEIRDQQS